VFAEMMDSHGEALIKQCQVMALKGDPTALRLCIERLLPPCKPSNNRFLLPAVKTASDVGSALQSVLQEVARGRLSGQEGEAIAGILETKRRAIETEEFGKRLQALEQQRQSADGKNHASIHETELRADVESRRRAVEAEELEARRRVLEEGRSNKLESDKE
jgi:hypothetical protein